MAKVTFDANGLALNNKGTSAYARVGYYATWQAGWAYVAIISMSKEDAAKAGKKAYLWHLSAHEDPRDAAYAAAKFYENYEDNLVALNDMKAMEWVTDNIPVLEHDAVDTDRFVEARNNKVARYNERKAKAKVKTRKAGNVKVDAVTSANGQVQAYAKFATTKAGLSSNVSGMIYKIVSDRKFVTYDQGKTFVDAVIANAKAA